MEEKTFCVSVYLVTKSFESVRAKYLKSFSFNNCPLKFQISRWVKKFKETVSLIKSSNKGRPSTCGRKLTARFPENVDAVRHSVRSLPESFPRYWTFFALKFWRVICALRGEQWFEQDGTNLTIEWLDRPFPDWLISRRRIP